MRARSLMFWTTTLLLVTHSVARPASAQVPNQRARACGCGDVGILPHYAAAGCDADPKMPSEGVYGWVRYSHLAASDYPGDHDWHDLNFYVKLDPAYEGLNSDANFVNNNDFLEYTTEASQPALSRRGERVMEIEWDSSKIPERFWATAGDRVWMTGQYIWDCGHPDGYHNEIHPPTALALTRLEPHTFAAGEAPSLTNKTYVYIHGQSGIRYLGAYQDRSVAHRDYEFDIDLPDAPPGLDPVAEVLELPFGGPAPILTIVTDASGRRRVHVKYPLNLGDRSPSRRFAAIIASGWRNPSPAVVQYRTVNVTFDSMIVNKQHSRFCQADWKLWLNVNGNWFRVQGLGGVISGSERAIGRTVSLVLPMTSDARLTIQASGWLNLFDFVFGTGVSLVEFPIKYPSIGNLVESGAEQLGLLYRHFSAAESFGIGTIASFATVSFKEISGEGVNTRTNDDFRIRVSIH